MLLILPTNATGIAQKMIITVTNPVVAAKRPKRSGNEMRMLLQIISAGLGERVRLMLKGMCFLSGRFFCAARWAAARDVYVMNAEVSALLSVCACCFSTI